MKKNKGKLKKKESNFGKKIKKRKKGENWEKNDKMQKKKRKERMHCGLLF